MRVRYPAARGRYGASAPRLVLTGVVWVAVGYAVLRWGQAPIDGAARLLPRPWPDRVAIGIVMFGGAVALLGVHRLARTAFELATPRRLSGEVLRVAACRTTATKHGETTTAAPVVHHLAVDDGGGDRTTAWALPHQLAGRAGAGDLVELTVRRWSRRVVSLRATPPRQRRATVRTLGADPGPQPRALAARTDTQ